MLDVDLDGLPGDRHLMASLRSRSKPFRGDPRNTVGLEDPLDGRRGDVDLVIAPEIEREPDSPGIALVAEARDERFHVWRRAEKTDGKEQPCPGITLMATHAGSLVVEAAVPGGDGQRGHQEVASGLRERPTPCRAKLEDGETSTRG